MASSRPGGSAAVTQYGLDLHLAPGRLARRAIGRNATYLEDRIAKLCWIQSFKLAPTSMQELRGKLIDAIRRRGLGGSLLATLGGVNEDQL